MKRVITEDIIMYIKALAVYAIMQTIIPYPYVLFAISGCLEHSHRSDQLY